MIHGFMDFYKYIWHSHDFGEFLGSCSFAAVCLVIVVFSMWVVVGFTLKEPKS